MKTKAVRLYGVNDLRLEEFELPEIKDDEILAHIISDSVCMSSHKAALQGAAHKRVPSDIAQNPTIIGHEFCGEIVEVGAKWKDQFKAGNKFSIQPAINLKENPYAAPGYSFKYIGGDATYVIIPKEVIEIATEIQSPKYKNQKLPCNGLFWYVQGKPADNSEIGERVPEKSYQILGITGPTLLVIPKYNIVVAKMYNKRYNYGGDNYLHYLREFSNLVADTFKV